VVGAGVSALLPDLVDHGYANLDAVDLSQAALDRLRDSLGDRASRVRFVRDDVCEVRLDSPVDVWHDRATFHFLNDADDRRAYAQRLRDTVRFGGHAIIATFSEAGPEQCSGLAVSRYSAESLHAQFADCFDLIESWTLDHLTPWGASQSFTHVLLRRADRDADTSSAVERVSR
jgi:SAM-dependent methyltransferase